MTGSSLNIPEFTPPSSDLQFLASDGHIYDYSNLYYFAEQLHKEIENYSFSKEKPLLIVADSSNELIFLIAAAFLLNVPIMIIHPDSGDEDILNILKKTAPPLLFTTQEERMANLTQIPQLSIHNNLMEQEAGWNDELFSFENPESVAGLFLTSGSTAQPKVVPIKRRQVYFAAESSARNFKTDKNRYWLLCLPLNHIGGISIIYRSLLYNSAIFRVDRFNVDEVRTFLSENKLFEVASFVPTMLNRLLEDPLFQTHSSFKAILLGGGPVTTDFLTMAATRGMPLVASYGMTETCAQIAANSMLMPSGIYTPKSSSGKIFNPNEIEIRDESGKVLPAIEEGQIWLKGPQVFDGYLDQNLNKKVFDKKGWFNTGDYGHLNRNGLLFVKNRRTDLIVTGGENVNPFRVEEELNKLSGVKESAVFGVPDPKWGQKVVAVIVNTKEEFRPDYIKAELKKTLRNFQIPKEFIEAGQLPKTPLGKIKRAELMKIYGKKEN